MVPKSSQVAPPPLEFHDKDPQYQPLFLALGRATMYWAAIEHQLSVWFILITRMKEQMGNDVFFRPNSFTGRLAILKAAMEHARMSKDLRDFLEAASKKANTYSIFRNSFVHGISLTATAPFGVSVPMIVDGSGAFTLEKLAGGITAEKLDRASSNFAKLTRAMLDAGEAYRSPARLRALRAQVERLPNEPASAELSQKQLAREKQRQADAQRFARLKSTGKAK